MSESPSVVNIQYFGNGYFNFIFHVVAYYEFDKYLRLMNRDGILFTASRARIGVVLTEQSMERR